MFRSLRSAKMADRTPTLANPPMLSSSPQSILHDYARDLDGFSKPKQAHNYNKVNGDTEANRQKHTGKGGTMDESGGLQPPASSRGADCADQLLAYGPHHECGANANRATRITNRGYGNEQACNDHGYRDPCGAKGQTSENCHEVGNDRNDPPISPAVRPPDGKMEPAL